MKFLAQMVLVVLLLLLGVVLFVGGLSVWHVPTLPEAYARPVPVAVAGWQITPVGAGEDAPRLGPLAVDGQWHDKTILDALGTPDRWEVGPGKRGIAAYYALGTQVLFQETSDGRIRIVNIVLGNPNANSAEDPLVKACPFAFANGVRLGEQVNIVNQRFRRAIRHLPRISEGWGRINYDFRDGRLVGVTLM